MFRIASSYLHAALAFGGLALATGAHAQASLCRDVLYRMDQLPKTPHHQFISMGRTAESKLPLSESISTGTAIYVSSNGHWRNIGFTPYEMSKRETEARRQEKSSCAIVREDALDGVSATLYSIQTEAPFGKMDSQVWVSKSTGLPLLEEYMLDTGAEKSYYEVRFVYSGVESPMDAD